MERGQRASFSTPNNEAFNADPEMLDADPARLAACLWK